MCWEVLGCVGGCWDVLGVLGVMLDCWGSLSGGLSGCLLQDGSLQPDRFNLFDRLVVSVVPNCLVHGFNEESPDVRGS